MSCTTNDAPHIILRNTHGILSKNIYLPYHGCILNRVITGGSNKAYKKKIFSFRASTYCQMIYESWFWGGLSRPTWPGSILLRLLHLKCGPLPIPLLFDPPFTKLSVWPVDNASFDSYFPILEDMVVPTLFTTAAKGVPWFLKNEIVLGIKRGSNVGNSHHLTHMTW